MSEQDSSGEATTVKFRPPTVGELAQIAALVYPSCEGRKGPPQPGENYVGYWPISREQEAMQTAARLWLWGDTYREQINKAAESPDRLQLLQVAGEFDLLREANYLRWLKDNALIGFDAIHRWVQEHATSKKDRALSHKALVRALEQFGIRFNEDYLPAVAIEKLREFLASRTRQRSEARISRRNARRNRQQNS